MRAAVITAPGEIPVAGRFADPEPLPGREPLALVAAGIHQLVRSLAAGSHYGSSDVYPQIAGVDAVARTGDGRLVYTGGARPPWGTFAERMVTPMAVELPVGADPLAVAAGLNPAMSGWMPLTARRAEPGGLGTVVVIGATGMSGGMAVQSALAMGADRVVAVGRNQEALERLRSFGAVVVPLDGGAEALAGAIQNAGPLLILDYVWGEPAEMAFAALGRRGLDEDRSDISYVQIGALAGTRAGVPASLLRSRRIRLSGSGAGSFSARTMAEQLPRIMAAIADGTLDVRYRAFPLSRVGEAWAHRGPQRAVVTPDDH